MQRTDLPAARGRGGQDGIPSQALAVLDGLAERASGFELPPPPEELARLRDKLAANAYQVLVLGEAKRGKSSFVNALIGRDLLPTDVDVATSQVFKISRAQQEAYRARFEDDSTKVISPSDLARFGSQVVADAQGRPQLDQTLRWIEVDVPARFLPRNVSILDTPGLGALYAAHAQITYRFVPQADAVIFVLDSDQPIVRAELELIERILRVTPSIFFIQTKIDLYSREDWEARKARSEAVLAEHFGDRLPDPQVWPISNKNLRKATESPQADAFLMVSRYQELAQALEKFLHRLAGGARAAEALVLASSYHRACRNKLAGRLASLESDTAEELASKQRAIAQRRQQFESDWGPRGPKRAELSKEVKRTIAISKQAFREAIQSGGRAIAPIEKRIDAIASVEEANELGARLADDLLAAAMEEWRQVRALTEERASALMASFLDVAETVAVPDEGDASLTASDSKFEASALSAFEGLTGVSGGIMAPVMVMGLLGMTTSTLVLVPVVAWALPQAWQRLQKNRVTAAKNELRHFFRLRHQEVQQQFLGADLSTSRFSLVDEYFRALEDALGDYLNRTVRQKSEEAEGELERLRAQGALPEEQRAAEAERLRTQLGEWDRLGAEMGKLSNRREVKGALAHLGVVEKQGAPAVPGAGKV